MTRWITLLVLLLGVVACDASTPEPPPVVPVSPLPTAPSRPASSVAPVPEPKTHVWTVLPYVVTDGMEYGPQQLVLDEAGKTLAVRLAGLPAKEGYSLLVRVGDNGPMPREKAALADFVWPDYRVIEVLAERQDDPAIDWSAPVVSADVTPTPGCLQITLRVFEGHSFCSSPGSLPGVSTTAASHQLLFLAPDFYPFPPAGAPVGVTLVPPLAPLPLS